MCSNDSLAHALNETLRLINLKRFVQHVRTCPHPACGTVFSIDGNCKVVREICGQPLPAPADIEFNCEDSIVHNSFSKGILYQKVCSNLRPHRKVHQQSCLECALRNSEVSQVAQVNWTLPVSSGGVLDILSGPCFFYFISILYFCY